MVKGTRQGKSATGVFGKAVCLEVVGGNQNAPRGGARPTMGVISL